MWVKSAFVAMTLAAHTAQAAEPKSFGDWTAFCALDAGCALATASEDGHRLAFAEPNTGEDRMVFLPVEPIQDGSVVIITLDGQPSARLGPGDGWRLVDMPGGAAAQIAPSIAENELMVRMPTRTMIEISYVGKSGKKHVAALSLKGYSTARAYVTSRQ